MRRSYYSGTGTYPPELGEYCESVASLASTATLIETSESKPGNASRFRDIGSVTYLDLVTSAALSTAYYAKACVYGYLGRKGVYKPMYESIQEVTKLGYSYSILGTAILLYPLLYESPNASSSDELVKRASQLVRALDEEEADWFLKAISLAPPSYLGTLEVGKDYRSYKGSLSELLLDSSNHDEIVSDLVGGYRLTLRALGLLREVGLVGAFLQLLCERPDGLIVRKHGSRTALLVSEMACSALKGEITVEELDSHLISNGLNPGSTADIIAVASFLDLYDRWWSLHPDYKGYLRKGCSRVSRSDN